MACIIIIIIIIMNANLIFRLICLDKNIGDFGFALIGKLGNTPRDSNKACLPRGWVHYSRSADVEDV